MKTTMVTCGCSGCHSAASGPVGEGGGFAEAALHRAARASRGRDGGLGLLAVRQLLHRQLVGDVVLVDVAHVRDRLPADALGGDPLDVVEPEVRIEPALLCLATQLADPGGAAVV